MLVNQRWLGILIFLAGMFNAKADHPNGPSADALEQINRDMQRLGERLLVLQEKPGAAEHNDLIADAELFHKSVNWALRYEAEFGPADLALLKKALTRGFERAAALKENEAKWTRRKGKLIRGYRSAVDGSVQPFGLVIPTGYDPSKPSRLDVVLHGSMKSAGLNELRFTNGFDEGDGPATNAPELNYIELHPLGRVENCYRWAGETDVFEAIEAVCRNYAIDRGRIVLRGMSMGASGTWHLGLKHPDRFVALGPYCGYVDTHEFSKTPIPTFVKVGELPEYQEKGLRLLDSIGYAANAGMIPTIACIGEKDIFFQAHVLMGKAMEREGLAMINLISPGTGHVIDPVTHAEQMRRINTFAEKGLNPFPRHLRFVTWSLKYGQCHWLQLLGLGEHYARGEWEAAVADDGSLDVKEPANVTRFALSQPVLREPGSTLRINGKAITLPVRDKNSPPLNPVIGQKDGAWVYLGERGSTSLLGKRPGLQGPIDDAFTTPFLCVRGTGKPWNPAVQAWAEASLKRFIHEWERYFRGEPRVKNDIDLTQDDIQRYNLILFGDPGNNAILARVLPGLPLKWSEKAITFGSETYASSDHAPIMIQPNPLAAGRYVVINSGHTFHEKELSSLNYLLFPRLGDWAILKVSEKSEPFDETVIQAGYFDENWLLP